MKKLMLLSTVFALFSANASETDQLVMCLQGKRLGDSKDYRRDLHIVGAKIGCEGPVIDVNTTLTNAKVQVDKDRATITSDFTSEMYLHEWRVPCIRTDVITRQSNTTMVTSVLARPFRYPVVTYSSVKPDLGDDRANEMAYQLMRNAIAACLN